MGGTIAQTRICADSELPLDSESEVFRRSQTPSQTYKGCDRPGLRSEMGHTGPMAPWEPRDAAGRLAGIWASWDRAQGRTGSSHENEWRPRHAALQTLSTLSTERLKVTLSCVWTRATEVQRARLRNLSRAVPSTSPCHSWPPLLASRSAPRRFSPYLPRPASPEELEST